MQTIITANPIYQHSGETEKLPALSQQASVNEDQEQRRRQLDKTGEQHKKLLAKEVSTLVDQFGGNVHLKATPYTEPSKPILEQAQESATSLLSSALEAGKNIINSATHAAQATTETLTNAASSALDTASNLTNSAVNTASNLTNSAVNTASNLTTTAVNTASSALNTASHVGHDAAVKANELAHDAAHQASLLSSKALDQASILSSKAVDTASSAATTLTQKSKEIANVATDKAFEIADNISHFTTLVGVLAEEENERARRLVSGDEARAAANAFRVSELIRDLGEGFYKQTPNLLYTTKVLEEAERRWRLNSGAGQLGESNAHKEGKIVLNSLQNFMPRHKWVRTRIAPLEEKERTRRLNDPAEAYAIINALNASFLIRELGLGSYRQEGTFSRTHAGYATTLLEENERRDRIRTHNLHLLDDAHHSVLTDLVSNNVEKFNYSTRNAKKFANEFASLLGNATMRVASQFSNLTKDFASQAADRVKTAASDLKSFTNIMYVVALEEKERARRLADSDEISAINNAWLQSQLIRDLSALYKPSSLARYPLGLIEEQERAWRLSSVTPSASRKLAGFVSANSSKFESAMQRAYDRERAHAEQISQSRLNPRAPAFVPHSSLPAQKIEPAPVVLNVASRAQL